ncbi:MAG: exo-alpha-sialidase [Gammaproteobacteria bacterium]|nr:MAG: exo-alpha-sialidase [Gammaproteobacteria bacterium]
MRSPLFFFAVATLAIIAIWQFWSGRISWLVMTDEISVETLQAPKFSKFFIFEQEAVASVHASAIVSVSGNELLAVWYAGSREGSGDVAIYGSKKGVESDWSKPGVLISRAKLAQDTDRHIKKLGNPVLLSDGGKKVWMFFVSTSIGGWSTSAINLVVSHDAGQTWGRAKRLITSPFLNISTLVKGRPFFYQDGTIGLPAYHELAGKFAELIRVTQDGDVLDKVRITHGRYSIQPSIASLGGDRLIALMRNTNTIRYVLRAYGEQGGKVWSKSAYTDLPNPDAAVSMAGDKDLLVVVYNDLKHDRNQLALAVSMDKGLSWNKRFQLESSGPDEAGNKLEFSYPYLYRTKNGEFHLVYTWQRKRIAYVSFNRAWLVQ